MRKSHTKKNKSRKKNNSNEKNKEQNKMVYNNYESEKKSNTAPNGDYSRER